MRPELNILSSPELTALARRWKIKELALFGSALREDFRPESDVDLLVTFDSASAWSLFDVEEIRLEFKRLLGREVDLVSRPAIERSLNQRRKQAILSTAKVVYNA